MKKFLIRLIVFFAIVLSICSTLDYIIEKGLRKTNVSPYLVWNKIYDSKINADMIFSGSSKTYVELCPQIFDSILKLNSYNLALDGWTFNMQYCRFKIYLQHNNNLKYIIQNVDFGIFEERNDLFNFPQFLPYLHDTLLKNTTDLYIGKLTFSEMYVPLFKYNNQFNAMNLGIKSFFSKNKNIEDKNKGYNPNDKTWDSSFHKFVIEHPNGLNREINPLDIKNFEDFLITCKQKNIKVILEFPPQYYESITMVNNRQEILDKISEFAIKYNCIYLNYLNDSLCTNKKYFYNSQHLNKLGSEIFSTHLATDIKNIIK